MDRTGIACIRLAGVKIFYKVIINELDHPDAITASQIHNVASPQMAEFD